MKPFLLSLFGFLRGYRVAFCALGALLCALWCTNSRFSALELTPGLPFETFPSPLSEREDAKKNDSPWRNDDDSVRISHGFTTKPTFVSTFRYWVDSWPGGDRGPSTPFGPYYRPLTSQLWWLQLHSSGDNGLFVFLLIHLFWHIAFVMALWATLRLWWNDTGALLTLWIWAVGLAASINNYATPFDALIMWKDDPEMTVGLSVLGAMAAARAFVLTDNKKYVVWALLAFALALSFKESGYVTPFFVCFTLWRFGATKKQWRVAPLFFVAAILAFAYRTWAIQGLGGHHGENGSWFPRALAELLGGTISVSSFAGNSIGLGLAALAMAFVHWVLDRRKIALFWLGFTVLAWGWAQVNDPVSDEFALIRLCDFAPTNLIYASFPLTLLMLALWQLFLVRRPLPMVIGWGWCLLAYLPLLKQAVTGHGFYFFSVGWAIWLAGAGVELARQFQEVTVPFVRRLLASRALQTKTS